MHSNIIVLKSNPDCPCSMTEDDIFENMHGVADYVQFIDITETKDIVNYLQKEFYNSGIDINIHIDPEDDKRVMVVIQNPKNTRNKYLTDKFTNFPGIFCCQVVFLGISSPKHLYTYLVYIEQSIFPNIPPHPYALPRHVNATFKILFSVNGK